jgi:uncharacterized protein YkwD
VPASRPARHRAGQRRVQDPGRRFGRRARYLLCGLLVLPALTAVGLYLAGAPWAGAAPTPGKVTSLQTPATAASVPPVQSATVASVPPVSSATRAKRPAVRPAPTASASSAHASSSATTPASTVSATDSAGTAPGSPASQVLAVINQARAAAGLSRLTVTADLARSASAHNLKMVGGCGLSHQCPAEPDLGARETAVGVVWSACGENIGEGGPVADAHAAIAQMAVGLTQDMLNEKPPDDGHRQNILSRSFTHIGIAIYRDSSGTVWLTQDFSN